KLQGEQENLSGVAGVLLRQLQELAVKSGCLIMVIHHRNKNDEKSGADSLAGTSDWGAAPDVILLWDRPDTSKPGTLTIEGRMPPIEPLAIRITPQECTYIGAKAEESVESFDVRILTTLGDSRLTPHQLEQLTGKHYSTIMKYLNRLKEEGKV